MKLMMENWRRFINEDEEMAKRASTPTKVGINKAEYQNQKKVLQDLIAQDYVAFVGALQKRIKDPKFRQFLNMGIEDRNMEDDLIGISEGPIPVKDLKPTQSQIGLADSLGWVSQNKPTQAGETATGDVADVGGPIITANGQYIVDGHHRWSQVFLLNPNASIPAIDFRIEGNPDAKSVLKLTQLAIAAVDRVLPLVPADAKTDIFATRGDPLAIKRILNQVVSDEMAQSLMKPYQARSKEEVINKITANAVGLFKRGTHNPDVPRKYMPQLDKVSAPSKKIAKIQAGDLNWNREA